MEILTHIWTKSGHFFQFWKKGSGDLSQPPPPPLITLQNTHNIEVTSRVL